MRRPRQEEWIAAGLAALSGLALAAAFPKPGWSVLGWVALAPLIAAAARSAPGPAAGWGLLCGLIFHGLSLPWLVGVMAVYGELGTPLSIPIFFLLALYLSLYPAAFTATLSGLYRRFGSPALALAPVVWTASELLRGWLLTGFPWNLLAYTQAERPEAVQLAALAGAYGVSFVLAASSSCVAYAFLTLSGGVAGGAPRRPWRGAFLGLAAAALRAGGALAFGQLRLARLAPLLEAAAGEGEGRPPARQVVMIQCNVAQSMKMSAANRQEVARLLYAVTREACHGRRPDLVIWPESSIPFLHYRDEPGFRREIGDLVRELQIDLLFGSVDTVEPLDGDEGRPGPDPRAAAAELPGYTNSALLLDRQGRLVAKYDKMRLVPFGEYVPARGILFFAGRLVAAVSDFTPGKAYAIMRPAGIPAGCLICYEVIFPELARGCVRRGANLLVTITNDAWFGDSAAPDQHFHAAIFRAVENGRTVLRCANTGISGVIDPLGRVLYRSPLNQRLWIDARVNGAALDTPYTRYGDTLAWGCLVLWGWSIALLLRRRRGRGSRHVRDGRDRPV